MSNVITYSKFTDFDIDLFKSGKHFRLYDKLGSFPMELNGEKGTYFAVWAPSAKNVSVIGDFNYWIEGEHPLNVRWDGSGIWEGFIEGVHQGDIYKYKIQSHHNDVKTEKSDPYAKRFEHPPKNASVVWELNSNWKDEQWMKDRKKHNALDRPFSVYEVHLTSWKRMVEEDRSLSYLELADELVDYVKKMNFTHVELMPVMEYPFDPSWGYQVTGYFAPTSRFDGTHVYEHPDRKRGYHPDWKSLIFNYGRNEVRSFLISNALFWLDQYHADGIRVDAVASMLFLDYSREDGEWEPNKYGGRENLEAISFMKELNETIYKNFPDVQTIAEESTSYPMVSKPTYIGGLGFGMKWMMGWMNDTLTYFAKDPAYRKYHQNDITFSLNYAFNENFMLPLSHDEVVHGKGSMFEKMPGDDWQKLANLRVLYGYMLTHPGTNLLFQGNEFGQRNEWNFQHSLDWHQLDNKLHQQLSDFVSDLNQLYKYQPALFEKQFDQDGFEWIDFSDDQNSVMVYMRKGERASEKLLIALNLTPVPRENYRIGLPECSSLELLMNSDDKKYGGSGNYPNKKTRIEKKKQHGRRSSTVLDLPPLAAMIFSVK